MNQAARIPASEKRPEDFLPPPLPKVEKKVSQLTITRKNGSVETTTIILRPGDVAAINGKTVLEG